MSKSQLLLVQPYLTKYRLPVFNQLNKSFDVTLIASKSAGYGKDVDDKELNICTVPEYSVANKIFWQRKILTSVLFKNFDLLFITANPRYLSTWLALIFAKLKGVKVLLHGQGLYSKRQLSLANKITYLLYYFLCDRYIAYTASSKKSLKTLPIYNKCDVAENSVVNKFPIDFKTGSERGILFLGRLRECTEIEMLLEVCLDINSKVNNESEELSLHIIGGGDKLLQLKKIYSEHKSIIFYGEVYDNSTISEISKKCFAGCYPGDAGLSILHYMSLSLPVIAHSDLHSHMGPEPSYISDNHNGLLFKRGDKKSLKDNIINMRANHKELIEMQANAFLTYKFITEPPLSSRLAFILNDVLES